MHPLADLAVEQWCQRHYAEQWFTALYEPGAGKMFAVMVASEGNHLYYYIAHSGKLAGQWTYPGFVPAIADTVRIDALCASACEQLARIDNEIQTLEQSHEWLQAHESLSQSMTARDHALQKLRTSNKDRKRRRRQQRERFSQSGEQDKLLQLNRESQHDRAELKRVAADWDDELAILQNSVDRLSAIRDDLRRKKAVISADTQRACFSEYQLKGPDGTYRDIVSLFTDITALSDQLPGLPPSGAGDCAAPKLLHYAWCHTINVLALSEFWVGTAAAGTLRHDRQFYPPCRRRCQPLMQFLLPEHCARDYQPPSPVGSFDIVYKDTSLLVVDKPSGMLSVPGKTAVPAVIDEVSARLSGKFYAVHRLDLETSGLLLLARSLEAYRHLQRQFLQRSVTKQYEALLDGLLVTRAGTISLPLTSDLDDRPRQRVCPVNGKVAITDYELIEASNMYSRVTLKPHTGRTHQLRLHCAHPHGLGMPIIGDSLYGRPSARMQLHACQLAVLHPTHGDTIEFRSTVPF